MPADATDLAGHGGAQRPNLEGVRIHFHLDDVRPPAVSRIRRAPIGLLVEDLPLGGLVVVGEGVRLTAFAERAGGIPKRPDSLGAREHSTVLGAQLETILLREIAVERAGARPEQIAGLHDHVSRASSRH